MGLAGSVLAVILRVLGREIALPAILGHISVTAEEAFGVEGHPDVPDLMVSSAPTWARSSPVARAGSACSRRQSIA